MGWATRSFEVGTVRIEVPQSLNMEQTYEEFGGVTTHRMLDGAAYRQSNWTKLRAVISVSGMVTPGLDGVYVSGNLYGIDWLLPQIIKCGVARTLTSASNVIMLPSARRTDSGYEPTGLALVDGMWRETPVALVGNTATLTVVTGAIRYMVGYFPQFTAYIENPAVRFDRTASTYSWTITAEEI